MSLNGTLLQTNGVTGGSTSSNFQLQFGLIEIIGYLLMMIMAGVNSMVGLGGGGPQIIILILLFNLLPNHFVSEVVKPQQE